MNRNTVVVLNTSQPVAMPWLDKVKGVIEMWWPGDEGGVAEVKTLLGLNNPGGKLSVTWASRSTTTPRPPHLTRNVLPEELTAKLLSPRAFSSAIAGSMTRRSSRFIHSATGCRTRASPCPARRSNVSATVGWTSRWPSGTPAQFKETKYRRYI